MVFTIPSVRPDMISLTDMDSPKTQDMQYPAPSYSLSHIHLPRIRHQRPPLTFAVGAPAGLPSLLSLPLPFPPPLPFSPVIYSSRCRTLSSPSTLYKTQRRKTMKKPPQILVLHLKHFERTTISFSSDLTRPNQNPSRCFNFMKCSYRVTYPLELKLTNAIEDAADTEYSLFAVVVHIGRVRDLGHYGCLVKSHNCWLYFDDEEVTIIDESIIHTCFGSQEGPSVTENGYILFYERAAG